MIHPERAVVRPMVRSAATGRTRPLDSAVAPLLRPGIRGRVAIVGGPGAGKTTALRHIASLVPGDARVTLIDNVRTDRRSQRERSSTADGVEFYASNADAYVRCDTDLDEFVLQPWDRDEWIEYLLAKHRQACSGVMQRLEACTDLIDLDGSPVLIRPVLDVFAADSLVTNVLQPSAGCSTPGCQIRRPDDSRRPTRWSRSSTTVPTSSKNSRQRD